MSDESQHDDREPFAAGNGHGEDAASDPLAPVLAALVQAAGLPPAELARRLREALPSAIAEIAEANLRLRNALHRRDALVVAASEELRAAAEVLEGDGAASASEAARLRRLADDLHG